MSRGQYDYIQARLQARHGQRPDAALWQRLGALRDLPLFLQTARASGLRPWLEGFTPETSAHRMEQLLRQRYRAEAEHVARWQPRPWQAATAWLAHWIDLPALGGLLRSEHTPEWMLSDPDYGPLAELPRAARAEALQNTRWAELGKELNAAGRSATDLRAIWFAHWRKLWPQCDVRTRAQVEQLAEALQHTPVSTVTTPAQDAAQREQWRSWLNYRFRQMPRAPVTSLLHLFMLAQDMERLRGELLQRRLFPSAGTENVHESAA
jgi:hypothetical protein